MSKVARTGTIQIEGMELTWEIKHLGGSSSMYENYRGLSVCVVLEKSKTKELVITYPFQDYWWAAPSSKTEFLNRLSTSIYEAIDAGWVPTKRGKAFIYAVPKRT